LGFAAVFIRFFAAPVVIEIYVFGILALIAAAASIVFTKSSVAETLLLDTFGWQTSTLALCYGVFAGMLTAWIAARLLDRESDPAMEEAFRKTDRTIYGTETTRRTHPALVALVIVLVIAYAIFMLSYRPD
jgi:hypothetical protein